MRVDPNEDRIDHEGHEEHGTEQHGEKLDITREDFNAGRGKRFGNKAENTDGGKADNEANHEFHALGSVVEHVTRSCGTVAEHNAHGDSPSEDADVVAGGNGVNGIVNHVENHIAEHFSDTAGSAGGMVRGNQNQLRREGKARNHGDHGSGERTDEIKHQNRLNVKVAAFEVLVGDGAHHRGNRLQGRHEHLAEEAALNGGIGGGIREGNTQNEGYENLFD